MMTDATNIPKFLAVDFYCGAGGTTRGLLDAGGYVIAGIDKDAGCSRTYDWEFSYEPHRHHSQ